MEFHSAAWPTDAPSRTLARRDALCFSVFNVLPDSLAMEHLPDVGTRLNAVRQTAIPREADYGSYPRHYTAAFALSGFVHPRLQRHALR